MARDPKDVTVSPGENEKGRVIAAHTVTGVSDGVTPTVGIDYTFRLKFDYRYGVYSVAVSDGGVMKPLVAASGASLPAGTARFPLAARKSSVSAVRFAGDGVLTSIFGEYGKKDWFNVIVR